MSTWLQLLLYLSINIDEIIYLDCAYRFVYMDVYEYTLEWKNIKREELAIELMKTKWLLGVIGITV